MEGHLGLALAHAEQKRDGEVLKVAGLVHHARPEYARLLAFLAQAKEVIYELKRVKLPNLF